MSTKMVRIAKIKKDNPELAARTDVQDVAADIDLYAALAGVASSEGGKALVGALSREIASTVQEIAGGYKTLPEMELRSLGAKLAVRLIMVQSLKRARTNLDLAEDWLEGLIV